MEEGTYVSDGDRRYVNYRVVVTTMMTEERGERERNEWAGIKCMSKVNRSHSVGMRLR